MTKKRERYGTDQILKAIGGALADREFDVIPGLLHMLAIADPEAAQRALDALNGKLTIDLGGHR